MSRSNTELKGLSIDRLYSLSRVVRHGTITKAAGGGGSRQTQLSRQVRELEGYFGVDLLDRSSKQHRPTVAAEELADLTEAFLNNLERLRRRAADGRSKIVIGAGNTAIRAWLIPLAKHVIRKNIRLVLRNLTSRSIQAELKAGRLDLGILHCDRIPDGCEHKSLPTMRMCLIAPKDTARAKELDWSDLADTPVALLEGGGRFPRFVRDRAREAGVRLDVALECSSSIQVIDAVQQCQCFGFIPDQLRKHLPADVEMIKLRGLDTFLNDYAVAWHKAERVQSEALEAVLSILLRK